MKRLVLACALVLLGTTSVRADGVMIEGFYWDATSPDQRTWWDYLSDHCAELKRTGVTGIWAPPATKGSAGGYSDGYDLYDYYDLGSKDQMGSIPPMRLRPGSQTAQLMWAQQFKGEAINLSSLIDLGASLSAPAPLAERRVQTQAQ